MLAVLLLSVVGTTFAVDALLSEDDETNTSDDVADLGASFSVTDTGVSIELGEDETGGIAVMYYTDTEDPSARVGDIETSTPIDSYYLAANTDGDDLVTFLPTDYVVTINGVPETTVTEDTVGSDGDDDINITAGTVLGGTGDDTV